MWTHFLPADYLASATGVVGVLGVAVGQIPVIDGIPPWVTGLLVGVVPTTGLFLLRVLRSVAAFYHRRHVNATARVAELKLIPNPDEALKARIYRYQEMADLAGEKHAAISTFALNSPLPKTGTE